MILKLFLQQVKILSAYFGSKKLIVIYFLSAALLVWLFALISYLIMKRNRKKLLKKIRTGWGQPDDEYRNFELIENYSRHHQSSAYHRLTPQTIKDLDFHQLFCFIDRTNSSPGRQYLFDKLLRPSADPAELEIFNKQVGFFSANKKEREEVQILLSAGNNTDAYFISHLLTDKLMEKSKWTNIFIADTVLVSSLLVLSFKFPVLLIWLILPFGINLFFHHWNKKNTGRFSRSLPQLDILLKTTAKLLKKDLPFEKAKAQLSMKSLKGFQRKFRFINLGKAAESDLAQILLLVSTLLKALFLVEIHFFFSVMKTLNNKSQDIDQILRYTGNIDAAISTASLRAGIKNYCTPVFTGRKKELHTKSMVHPLVENCVPNSIDINDRSILITGSNMSGKSTFIRAVAINCLLAQTIYTCFAEEYIAPLVKLFSAIRIEDSVMDGKSYYFEEVNIISVLIGHSPGPFQNMFILDEVFKGTNTIERVAAAKAILSYLNKNENIVLVSTHDIELAELLKNEYDLYHFVDDIEKEELVFDHKLKQGPLLSRNAIRMLELSGYPAEITNEAKRIAQNK